MSTGEIVSNGVIISSGAVPPPTSAANFQLRRNQSYRSPSSSPDFSILPQEAEYIIDLAPDPAEVEDSFDFVENPPEDYICQVCLNVLSEPHVTDCCGQHFCRRCLEACVNEYTKMKSCPHCRETRFRHMIYKPYQRRINELNVYCKNRDKGCPEVMNIKAMQSHLSKSNETGCQYVAVPCPNGCQERISRRDIERHCNKACKQRKVACDYCGIKTIHYLLDEHTIVCDSYPVTCSRGCTEELMLRCDLQSHEEVCPKKRVKCPFFEVGCSQELPREEVTAHVESNASDHMSRMMEAYCKLKREFDSLKREHMAHQDHC